MFISAFRLPFPQAIKMRVLLLLILTMFMLLIQKVLVPQWGLLFLRLAILRQRALMQGRLQAELIQ